MWSQSLTPNLASGKLLYWKPTCPYRPFWIDHRIYVASYLHIHQPSPVYPGTMLQQNHRYTDADTHQWRFQMNQKALLNHSRLSHPIILSVSRCSSIQTVQLPINPSTPSARLHHSSSLVFQDDQTACFFMFGGRSSPRVALADAYIIHCKTQTWTPVNPSAAENSWPPPRFRHVALSIQIKQSTYVSIHGGIGLEGAILTDVWLLDPNQSRWTQLIAVCDQGGTSRIGNNIKLAVAFGEDLGLEIRSDLPELVDLKLNGALVQRSSHQIAMWDEQNNTLIMSGGILDIGVITTEHQTSDQSAINLPQKGDSCRPGLKEALVIGGGATCFSFGSSFGTLAEILLDSDLRLAEHTDSSEKNESGFSPNLGGTFDHSPEDTWDQAEEVPRIGKLTSQRWTDATSAPACGIRYTGQDRPPPS
ncbi:hypothetical protein PCANC_16963 [Puccinia coronata f. sp. avenae]|uniref:Uncharacterized protein n=1 Tax=Puccinia coronata f. sp. avenae TaxID=200324 RepID=A0A2N5SHT8_9BASI|nr:hypothetical protein PCANC_16963 [Puccinia coronata f. sp. avenae]